MKNSDKAKQRFEESKHYYGDNPEASMKILTPFEHPFVDGLSVHFVVFNVSGKVTPQSLFYFCCWVEDKKGNEGILVNEYPNFLMASRKKFTSFEEFTASKYAKAAYTSSTHDYMEEFGQPNALKWLKDNSDFSPFVSLEADKLSLPNYEPKEGVSPDDIKTELKKYYKSVRVSAPIETGMASNPRHYYKIYCSGLIAPMSVATARATLVKAGIEITNNQVRKSDLQMAVSILSNSDRFG